VGEENDDSVFVPLRTYYPASSGDRRDKIQRQHEQQIAERVSSRKEQLQQRGREPRRLSQLSRADIVATAVAIADAEGTDAVSMRRIARDLRFGAMSLYWYVGSKDELQQYMLDAVQGETEAVMPSGDWRADLTTYALSTRTALKRHPWAADFIGAGPPIGPNDARNAERLLSTLDALRLDVSTSMWALMTLLTYVMGAALREVQEVRWHRAEAEAEASMSEAERAEVEDKFERQIRDGDRYPHLAKILDSNIDPDGDSTRDERFMFGLTCVLDGIEATAERLR
jgi:AcrR family transcriptional regulator